MTTLCPASPVSTAKALETVAISSMKGNHMKTLLTHLAIGTLVVLFGCSKSETVAPQSGTGTLRVIMVDSPAAFDEVNIVVDSVRAHISSDDTTGGWFTLNRTPATYDLLTLVNGANAVLGNAVLPVGQYSQIRLYIGSGSNVVVDGVPKPLEIPSGSQSGLKLNVDATILPDVVYILTLDFDAGRSIVITGNPNNHRYLLKPVIRAFANGTTGSIAGTVSPASTRPTVWAMGIDTVSTVADTATGGFVIRYLSPAVYSVSIVPGDTLYRDTTITGVPVVAAATTNLGIIVLQHR